MAVELQVRDVRAAIYQAAGGPQGLGDGSPSTALLGQVFHEVFASLIGTDTSLNFHAAIDDVEPELDEWRRALVKHSYQNLVGPRLRQHQALLHHITDQVLVFWDAVQEMCGWLAEVFWQLYERGDEELALVRSFLSEQRLVWEIHDPMWSDTVLLIGVADAVWKIPNSDQWCLVELKTGRNAPMADLAQACLYHQMISSSEKQPGGAMAMVSFGPQRHEHVYSAPELAEAQTALKQLIGKMAHVLPDTNRSLNSLAALNGTPVVSTEIKPEHLQLGTQLVKTLKEYGAEVKLDGDLIVGPAFLRFPVTLGSRVKVRLVGQLAKEIQIRLQLDNPPRIGTEGGRIVIDLQRQDRQTVLFSHISSQLPRTDPLLGCAQAPLGIDLAGRLRMIDFALPEDAHLLVAGTTGSGKSEWLRTAIAGLIMTNTPATLRLLIIDPKRNTFHALRNSSFLYGPIIFPGEQSVAEALKELADEMDIRYQRLGENGDDSITGYVQRTGRQMPRIFCICDEYADLISTDKQTRKEIERQITRLGQKARAAGIHLILATQQPSREIIKGVLDSNIPARVGLKMQKAIESKMLLNYPGAESLLGRGDLLFKDIGEPVRLQGARLATEEANKIFNR